MTSDSRSIEDEPGDVGANIIDLANDEPLFHKESLRFIVDSSQFTGEPEHRFQNTDEASPDDEIRALFSVLCALMSSPLKAIVHL
jgi:hypothetical protein